MTELKELHDKAIGAAMNAAFAVAEDEAWFLGGGEPTKKARKAWEMKRGAWLHFSRENSTAPAEALWIKGGALGLHDGKRGFGELPALIQMAFSIFHEVFNKVSTQIDLAARLAEEERRAQELAEQRAAAPPRKPTAEDLEDTVLEEHPDPLAPSEFAPKKTAAGYEHRYNAKATGDQVERAEPSPEFLRYQQEQAEKEEAEKAAAQAATDGAAS